MKLIASRLALIVAGTTLLAVMMVLATARPEYCGPLDAPKPRAGAALANAPIPTLAPPQKLVFVRVESDKPDIQVGWAEN